MVIGGRSLSGSTLSFALTPVFLDNEAVVIDALVAALSAGTGRSVVSVQRRSYADITGMVLDGDVDAAWLCGYPWMRHRAVLGLLAAPVWRGRPLYQSYLIAGRGDPATGLADLRGGTHAFSDPDSNSGYLVTATDLARMGERPDSFFRRTIFTWGHRNVVRAVASGLTRSGSVDGYIHEVLSAVEPGLVQATRIVARSEWIGFPPVVARRDRMRDPAMAELAAAFMGMSATDAGREALSLLGLDGFAEPDEAAYEPIAERMRTPGFRP